MSKLGVPSVDDHFPIFYVSHCFLPLIALIKRPYQAAGKISAFETKPHQNFSEPVAFLGVVTVFPLYPAAGAVCLPYPLLPQLVLHRQIAGTHATVHSTGSDQFFVHRLSNNIQNSEAIFITPGN